MSAMRRKARHTTNRTLFGPNKSADTSRNCHNQQRQPWSIGAPAQDEQGNQTPRVKGTPQGGVISPLLANLFLHYALDKWMARHYPDIPFERYADDAILHCRTQEQAARLREAIIVRLAECGLELNLQKTKIVYCKDDDRRGNHEHEKFTFLGSPPGRWFKADQNQPVRMAVANAEVTLGAAGSNSVVVRQNLVHNDNNGGHGIHVRSADAIATISGVISRISAITLSTCSGVAGWRIVV